MKIHANVMMKDEAPVLEAVLPIWNSYGIDEWVFYDDSSTDNSVELVKQGLDSKVTVINDELPKFDETHYRSRMLEHSRSSGADYVIAIDADELLSANLAKNLRLILPNHSQYDIHYYWYNCAGSIDMMRQDPLYMENYKSFIMPLKHTQSFDVYRETKIHTPRTAPITLPKVATKEYGLIHLQALNKRFYAVKQLRYKHFEYLNWNRDIDFLNNRYDPVVNGLNFMEQPMPKDIVEGISVDPTVFDKVLEIKDYVNYVNSNRIDQLITFGEEYL